MKVKASLNVDPARAKVRESLTPLLGVDLAVAVDECLYELEGCVGSKYRNQWRAIIANLRDPQNDLESRVVSGVVTPAALSCMTSKELASRELTHLREEIRRDAVKMVSGECVFV